MSQNEGIKMEHDYRDVLLKAASIIEEGWCQHNSFVNPVTNETLTAYHATARRARGERVLVCLGGSVILAARELEPSRGGELSEEARKRVTEALGGSPPGWNDIPYRTKEEVAALLRDVATE